MSVHVSSMVWRADIPMTKKIVLLKFADHASDDGSNVYPSQKRVATECGCTDRHVRSVEEWAVEQGILIHETWKTKRGKFRFDLTVLVKMELRDGDEIRNAVPENRNDVPESTVQKRNDVPVPEIEDRNVVPPNRNTVPLDRNVVPVIKNHQLTTNEPSVVPERNEPPDDLAEKVFQILDEVPGINRCDPDHREVARNIGRIREVLDDFPEFEPDDWLEIAKDCRDEFENLRSMKLNSVYSKPGSTCLREFVKKSVKPRLSSTRQSNKPVGLQSIYERALEAASG